MYNKNGLKLFLYITTINKNKFYELPSEIRNYIWKLAHIYPFVQCFICDKVLIRLNLNIDEEEQLQKTENENYTIINGFTKCNSCLID